MPSRIYKFGYICIPGPGLITTSKESAPESRSFEAFTETRSCIRSTERSGDSAANCATEVAEVAGSDALAAGALMESIAVPDAEESCRAKELAECKIFAVNS